MGNWETGKRGEERATAFLKGRGFEIVDRNFRYGKIGEIDIIARRDNLLIFVEVKSRNKHSYGGPLYSITRKKKSTLKIIASKFLILNPEYSSKDIICRFDMVAIINGSVEWIEDIFR
jgi:putative endonuclease